MRSANQIVRELTVFSKLLNARLQVARTQRLKAKDIARAAGIDESTLSLLRTGVRRPSKDVAERLARALNIDPVRLDKDLQEFLTSAGFAPESTNPGSKPEIILLYDRRTLLDIEARVAKGQDVWVFCRGLLETSFLDFYHTVRENLRKGVTYTYFLHPENDVDFIKLKRMLERDQMRLKDVRCSGILVPEAAFQFRDPAFFECVYNAGDKKHLRVFRTSLETQGEHRYREISGAEALEFVDYLKQMKGFVEANRSRIEPPVSVEIWLKKNSKIDLMRG
jgi:transcriptional regulator with XRE-family HTH domain